MSADADFPDLPEVLARFAEAAGLPGALRLAHELGGGRHYIPTSVDRDHKLAKALGLETAQLLIDLFGPGWLLVPLGPAASPEKQRQRIRQLIIEGKSRQEIVRLVRCHERTVQRLRRALADEGQGDLFDGFPPG